MTKRDAADKEGAKVVKESDDQIAVSQQGRAQGNLQRDIATQNEEKRAEEMPAGVTRVTGSDKRNHGEDA
ncbi:hypothetical protein Z945_1566 [Sulfitobacter noctilucae]|uniref:hypothetical protein n=1 Tax=Sulfitobacter noctilucae TaxID=1342302 RepID=UPI00046AB078|nr:hypothetical protein [Sulfitobacter noctilucae]KIN60591.1 hypothetical protein Z945_1566 [Sulfitobacter noctilucae]